MTPGAAGLGPARAAARWGRRRLPVAALALAAALGAAPARADSLIYCEAPKPVGTAQKDRLLRFAALVKDELDRSGLPLALIARSGTDLRRFDVRYSHAGVVLKDSANGPWSVRQLYFACEEGRPRLFDQGMTGFIFGADQAQEGHLSLVLLPAEASAALAAAALDNRRALELLSARYSANAHAFALAYQNCNQWVAELLADAWGAGSPPVGRALPPADAAGAGHEAPDPDAVPAVTPEQVQARRGAAQDWLLRQGYVPHAFELHWRPLVWVAGLLPWLNTDDHPEADRQAARFRVSMPAELETLARQLHPEARRVEFCHDGRRAVRHLGWEPMGPGCQPGPDDTVLPLAD